MKRMLVPLSLFVFVFAALSAQSDDDAWIVAAERFSFARSKVTTAQKPVAELLPRLVLEQLARNLERVSPAQETLDEKLYALGKSRIDLFLQLSKEVQMRDALALSDLRPSTLRKKIKDEEKKIKELKEKIDENLAEAQSEKDDARADIETEEARARDIESGAAVDDAGDDGEGKKLFRDFLKEFFAKNAERKTERPVRLYGDDFSKLFDAGDEAREAGYDSVKFVSQAMSAKINALVTGQVTIYDEYISVSATLYRYPGGKAIGAVTDVGSISDIQSLAASVARSLTPRITNTMPVELTFAVQPEDAASKITITVDDVAYRKIPERLVVDAGRHTVSFSAPGYSPVAATYAFRGRREFLVSADMSRDEPGVILLRFTKALEGSVIVNGEKVGVVGEGAQMSRIKVNNKNALGIVVKDDAPPAPFYVPLNLLQDGASLSVKAKAFDRSHYIDVRRCWLYGAYSALITSLIPMFYTYGSYNSNIASYNSGSMSYDELHRWQLSSQICIGVTIGCAVFFVYELVRYLVAADTVLPNKARKPKKSELRKLSQAQVDEPAAQTIESDTQTVESDARSAEENSVGEADENE